MAHSNLPQRGEQLGYFCRNQTGLPLCHTADLHQLLDLKMSEADPARSYSDRPWRAHPGHAVTLSFLSQFSLFRWFFIFLWTSLGLGHQRHRRNKLLLFIMILTNKRMGTETTNKHSIDRFAHTLGKGRN